VVSLRTVRNHFLFLGFALALPLCGQCRLPDVAPDALLRLTPAQLLDGGHFLRTEQILQPVVNQRPEDPQAAWMLSRAKAALGKLDEAMALAETALAQNPANAAYHVQVAAVAGRLAEKANLFRKLGYVKQARQELDAAAALDVRNSDTQWGLMMFYFAAPPMLGGDKAKAQQLGQQLAAAVPDLGRYYQGRLATEMKEHDKAEAFYKQSIAENPLLFDTAWNLATYYMRVKPDQAKAERWACHAVHADPTRADAWALLARVYSMCGCWTEAQHIAEIAETIDGEDLVAWYAIAEVAVERGEQYENAAAYLQKYLSRPIEGNQPGEASARLHLGTALARLGKQGEAAKELRAALELDSTLEPAKALLKQMGEKSR
jgi:tetratricopeptide (TPR) repeat protein